MIICGCENFTSKELIPKVIVFCVEMLAVSADAVAVLPYLAFAIQGFWLLVPVEPTILLVIFVSLYWAACVLILKCLIFRVYLLSGERIWKFEISERHFHLMQLSWYFYIVPVLWFISVMNVEKSKVPISYDSYDSLISPRVIYWNFFLNSNSISCAIVWTILVLIYGFLIIVCLFKIFYALNRNQNFSQRTKDLHRKAVYSSVFLIVPSSLSICSIVVIMFSLLGLQKLGVDVSFVFINRLIPSTIIGHSIVIGVNTLYHMGYDQVKLFFTRLSGKTLPVENQNSSTLVVTGYSQ
ncbi:unnamed protein product, partial [Mesorhabditis belari]|uniref:Uncharacterized protein n=1 Tax=Mesorhabditis belari TaxID=2138241 RepID=A0AAF3EHN8_9BILA